MKKVVWTLGGVVLIGGLVGVTGWAPWTSGPGRIQRGASPKNALGIDAITGAANSNTSEEVARLRAELQQKNAQILSLTAAKQASEIVQNQAQAALPAEELDPAAHAIDVLDERLYTAARDLRIANELERTLREVANSPEVGDAKVSSLYCSSTLCKVTLSATSGVNANRSMSAMAEHLPKTFGAAAVYESNGQSALYVGKSNQDLTLDSTQANEHPQQVVMQEGSKSTEASQHP